MTSNDMLSVREQIQEDIISFASAVDDEKIFFNDDVLEMNFATLLFLISPNF